MNDTRNSEKMEAHLFTPVLITLFAFLLALLGMQEKQTNECAEHAAENANSDNNINPDAKVLRLICRPAAFL